MKFFSNLPKTTFSSTIGDYVISDFFTYLDVDAAKITEANVTVDNKTTLLEAAYKIYGDSNSFWAFVAANNTINPFDLLNFNSTIFQKTAENKINFLLMNSPTAITGGMAFPVGSLIVPYEENTGTTSDYGSTGNYNFKGQMAVIEQSSFYDGNMVIGEQLGGTGPFITIGASSELVTVLKKTVDGNYVFGGTYYVTNKQSASSKVVKITNTADAKQIFKSSFSSNTTIDELLPASVAISGATSATTALQQIDSTSKNISAYVPSELGFVQSSFVTTKYN